MARHSFFSDIAAVNDWFTQVGLVKWNLYRGHLEKMQGNRMIYRQDDDTLDLQDSWDLLRDMIEKNSNNGGQFTIYVPNANSGNQGLNVHVELNMEHHRTGSKTTALSGTPSYALGFIPVEKHKEELQRERQFWELEKRLEDMEASQEAGLGIGDIIKDQLRGIDFAPIIAGLGNLIAAKAMGSGIQLQGIPADDQEPPAASGNDYNYDGTQLKPILDIIRPHFDTDASFYSFLSNLARLFAQSPEVYKTQIGHE